MQDLDLVAAGISVDKFHVTKGHRIQFFFLTHAHMDHMQDLKANFTIRRKHAKICTTRITADLAKLTVQGLSEAAFSILEMFQPTRIDEDLTVTAFPSFHCDGSCMFYFQLKGLKILYTGDFRWNPDIRKNNVLMETCFDRLYYDDMFDEIVVEYPTYAQTYSQIKMLCEKHDKTKKLFINVSSLGIEFILRELSDSMGIKFSLSNSLTDTWRGRQIKYLLGQKRMDQDSKIVLGTIRFDHVDDSSWIIPTCMHFLCGENHKIKKSKITQDHYVWFATHSNKLENTLLKSLVNAKQVNPCKDTSDMASCQ